MALSGSYHEDLFGERQLLCVANSRPAKKICWGFTCLNMSGDKTKLSWTPCNLL